MSFRISSRIPSREMSHMGSWNVVGFISVNILRMKKNVKLRSSSVATKWKMYVGQI